MQEEAYVGEESPFDARVLLSLVSLCKDKIHFMRHPVVCE